MLSTRRRRSSALAAVLVAAIGTLAFSLSTGAGSTSPTAAPSDSATQPHSAPTSTPAPTSDAAPSLGPNEQLVTLPSGETVVQYVPEDDSLPQYWENGQLSFDGKGNYYGMDGALVRDAAGRCAQGLAPGSDPAANICFDPSLVPEVGDVPGADLGVSVEDGVLHGELTVG